MKSGQARCVRCAFSLFASAAALATLTTCQNLENQHSDWQKITGIPEFDPALHSDGCSGGMSAAYAKMPQEIHDAHGEMLPWHQCCVVHDGAYYVGGSRAEKRTADESLEQCVADTPGGAFLARAMKIAVTPGGHPNFPTSFRWGYGEDFRA